MSHDNTIPLSQAIHKNMQQLFNNGHPDVCKVATSNNSEYQLMNSANNCNISALANDLRFRAESPEKCVIKTSTARIIISGNDISFEGSLIEQVNATGMAEQIIEETLGIYGCFDLPTELY